MVTKRGLLWEIANSLWIILSFLGLSFASFFYIGTKAKKLKWKLIGVFYFFINIVLLLVLSFTSFSSLINTLLTILWCIGLILGPVHSFLVRKEYLVRRDYILNMGVEQMEIDRMRDSLHDEYRGKFSTGPSGNDTQLDDSYYSNIGYRDYGENNNDGILFDDEDEFPNNYQQEQYKYQEGVSSYINVNTASKDELMRLPGVTDAIADKTIALRDMLGGFNSIQEFAEINNIDKKYLTELFDRATVR